MSKKIVSLFVALMVTAGVVMFAPAKSAYAVTPCPHSSSVGRVYTHTGYSHSVTGYYHTLSNGSTCCFTRLVYYHTVKCSCGVSLGSGIAGDCTEAHPNGACYKYPQVYTEPYLYGSHTN